MPKVDKAQIPLAVEHQVLGLEIAVHNAQTVQVHQRRDDHRQVERGGGWLEAVDLAQQVEELTAAHRLHENVTVARAVEPWHEL